MDREHTGQASDFSERAEEMRSRSKICLSRDQLPTQNFDPVLVVIVKVAGDIIFAKFCHDALSHILRHPRSIQTRDGLGWVWMGWYGWRWMGMGGKRSGWGFAISWMGDGER